MHACLVDFYQISGNFARSPARPSVLQLGSRDGTLSMSVRPSVDSVSCVACKVALYFRRAEGRKARRRSGRGRSAEGPQGFANVLNKANGESPSERLRESRALNPRNIDLCRWDGSEEWVRVRDVSAFRPMMAVTARIYLPKSEQRASGNGE